jgi:hypothetical protein
MNDALKKMFSGRYALTIIFGAGTMALAFYLVAKFPESAAVVWAGVSNITIMIAKDYFGRQDRDVVQSSNQK